jgi:transposase
MTSPPARDTAILSLSSGASLRSVGASRCGDSEVRTALYEAASRLLVRCNTPSELRSWGSACAAQRARVACLAVPGPL